ncbi:MAG TPA: hypothetical protein EYM90_06910, partial [Phycisphaerales bacterium]|nr:hypothetical protein [Phycisphaerales bacterium]
MALHLVKKKTCRPTKTIDNDFFVKHGISDFDVEVEKSKSLFAASVVGSFCAPKVLQFNSKDQSISFEYFEGIQSIRNVYLNYVSAAQPSDDDFQFLVKTGTVLAEIHELMHMHNPIDWIPSTLFKKSFKKKTGQDIEKLLDTMPWSIAHCDFGFSNIHYFQTKNHERELLIIDPSVNDFVTTETNLHAPIYVDLANLIACFSGLVPFRNY